MTKPWIGNTTAAVASTYVVQSLLVHRLMCQMLTRSGKDSIFGTTTGNFHVYVPGGIGVSSSVSSKKRRILVGSSMSAHSFAAATGKLGLPLAIWFVLGRSCLNFSGNSKMIAFTAVVVDWRVKPSCTVVCMPGTLSVHDNVGVCASMRRISFAGKLYAESSTCPSKDDTIKLNVFFSGVVSGTDPVTIKE